MDLKKELEYAKKLSFLPQESEKYIVKIDCIEFQGYYIAYKIGEEYYARGEKVSKLSIEEKYSLFNQDELDLYLPKVIEKDGIKYQLRIKYDFDVFEIEWLNNDYEEKFLLGDIIQAENEKECKIQAILKLKEMGLLNG